MKMLVRFVMALIMVWPARAACAVQFVGSDAALSNEGQTNGVDFTADATLSLIGSDMDINTADHPAGIVADQDGWGTLIIGTGVSSAIKGTVGTSDKWLKAIASTGSDGEGQSFEQDVHARTLTINNTFVYMINGSSLYVNTVNFTSDAYFSYLNIAGNLTATGGLTAQLAHHGVLIASLDSIVAGQIGTLTHPLMIVSGSNSGTDIFQDDIYADELDILAGITRLNGNYTGNDNGIGAVFYDNGILQIADGKNIEAPVVNRTTDGTGTLTFLGASDISWGDVGADGGGLGAVNIGDGTTGGVVTLGNDIYAALTSINNFATLSLSGDHLVGGNVTVAGTGALALGTHVLNVTGNFTVLANGTISTTINSAADYGRITATGNAAIPASATLNVDVAGTLPSRAAAFRIIDGDGTAGINIPGTLSITGSSRTFSLILDAGDLVLSLEALNVPYAPSTTTGNGQAAATVLEGISATATGDMGNVITTLNDLPPPQIDSAIQTMLPDTSGFNPQVPVQLLEQFVGVLMDHLGSEAEEGMGNGTPPTGMSSGDEPDPYVTWCKVFGSSAHQYPRGTSQGYNLSNGGAAIGIEKEFSDTFRGGLAAGDAQSWVRGKDNASRTDIETQQVSLYGGYTPGTSPWYWNGSLSYNYNTYGGSREIHISSSDSRIARADYRGHLFGASMETGYGIGLGKKTAFTPLVSLAYSHLIVPGYSETGAGSLDLNVDEQDYDDLRFGIGGKLEAAQECSFGKVTSEVHAKYLYDIIADRQNMVATFAGGGTAFAVVGYKPARSGTNVGTGLILATKKDVTLSLQYDLELRQNYYAHTGFLNVAYKF